MERISATPKLPFLTKTVDAVFSFDEDDDENVGTGNETKGEER